MQLHLFAGFALHFLCASELKKPHVHPVHTRYQQILLVAHTQHGSGWSQGAQSAQSHENSTHNPFAQSNQVTKTRPWKCAVRLKSEHGLSLLLFCSQMRNQDVKQEGCAKNAHGAGHSLTRHDFRPLVFFQKAGWFSKTLVIHKVSHKGHQPFQKHSENKRQKPFHPHHEATQSLQQTLQE